MFERYTEKCRRTIFFARYEAAQFGSPYIETEHLLLGLLRESKDLSNRLFNSHASVESIRKQVEQHTPVRAKVTNSADIPLSNESKRVLAYAAKEAETLSHKHIGTEHLLLGLLREDTFFAAKILTERGIRLNDVREQLQTYTQPSPPSAPAVKLNAQWPEYRPSSWGDTARELIRIQELTNLHSSRETEVIRAFRSIRIWLIVVILGLVLSGVTAFPLQHELAFLARLSANLNLPAINSWLTRVYSALVDTNNRYPFLAYGTDWLAFAHLVIAVAFIGAYLEPIRNKWIITWGLISCAGVPLLALIAGPIRGIPLYWRLIDCSFGVFCCIPLLIIRRLLREIEGYIPYSRPKRM